MSKYPKGSISTINELLLYRDKVLYHVSKTFCREVTPYCEQTFTGRIGVKVTKYDWENTPTHYAWYAVVHHGCDKPSTHSLVDANVIENSYNDWFLFHDRKDAEAYLAS